MFGMVLIFFALVGVNLFGGNISDRTPADWAKRFGPDEEVPRRGELMMNFNDYVYAVITLLSEMAQGWNHMKIVLFADPKYNNMMYPYFHFLFFFITNVVF